MAKTRGVTVTKEDGKWSWTMGDNLWELRLEPYAKRRLLRNGVILLGCVDLTSEPILCPDDAVLWSMGYEHAAGDYEDKGGAA